MPSLFCLVAHPDDETVLCGGTFALLAARGVDVHVVCLTRGEESFHRQWPAAPAPNDAFRDWLQALAVKTPRRLGD